MVILTLLLLTGIVIVIKFGRRRASSSVAI
jgi:hypothetical protein